MLTDVLGAPRFIYFAAPDNSDRPACWLTLSRIGGAPRVGDTPMDDALISFHAYGRTKAKAAELAGAVVNLIQSIRGPVAMGAVTAREGQVTGWSFIPEAPQIPRYVVDAAIYFTADAGITAVIPGGSGTGAGETSFTYIQAVPASVWTITHNLGRYAAVTVLDSDDDEVYGDYDYPDLNTVVLTFSSPVTGTAFLV